MKTEIKKIFLFLLAILLTGISCKNSSHKDYSFSPEEYREMGMPDHTRMWDYNNYQEACIVLNNIKSIKPRSLPRKNSRKSGEIFARIVNTDNLSFLQSDSMSLNQKAHLIQRYIDIQSCFVTAYTDLDSKEQLYNHELIDLYIFGLTIAQDMLDLGQMINESVDEKDIKMQHAYGSIQKMYSAMVAFVLMNQQKSYFFEKGDLERLSIFVYNSVMINKDWLKDTGGEYIKEQLKKIVENTSSDVIKTKYTALSGVL